MNIRFNYLYRDAGNYKAYGVIVFSGADRVSATDAELVLEKLLIDGEYFVAGDVDVPDLRPAALDCMLDHDWHEVESLEDCVDPPDDQFGRTIVEFIDAVRHACPQLK